MNKHRAKCDVLKKIRKGMADKLGVDLHQRECTFDGECKGTCPKCKQEEDILNREIARRAGALALGATASLMLTACSPADIDDGLQDPGVPSMTELAGAPMCSEDELPADSGELLGEPLLSEEFATPGEVPIDIEGDIAYEEGDETAPGQEETYYIEGNIAYEESEDIPSEQEETDYEIAAGAPRYDGED